MDVVSEKKESFQNRHRHIFSFIICTILIYALMEIMNITKYWWDAEEYQAIAQSFISEGTFRFVASWFSGRAYTWPFMFAALNGFGHFGIHVFRFLNSVMYSFLITGLMGNLFEEIFNIRISGIRRCIPVVLVLLFWPGLIVYPLTDLIAVLMSMLSIYMFYLMYKNDNLFVVFVLAIASGFASDAALNMRPTYKYNMYIGLAIIVFMAIKRRMPYFFLISIAGYILGAGLSAAPQIYANRVNYGITGWDNPLSYWNSGTRMAYLLYEGFINPRIECYVGPGSNEWINAAITSVDPVANAIFHKYEIGLIDTAQYGMMDFFKIILKHPAESASMYMSHFINCLDARYGIIYIEKFGGAFRYMLQVLSVMIYETLLIDAHTRLRGFTNSLSGMKKVVISSWFPVSCLMLLPVAVSLPGHIEPRYAIALHLLFYAYIGYKADLKRVWNWISTHKVITAFFFICMFTVLTLVQNWSLGLSGYNEFMY